jgi:hemerythrin
MERIARTPQLEVDTPSTDLAHQALIEQVARLLEQPDQQFEQGLTVLVGQLEKDFREEELLMEEVDYPGIPAHREQHARVLATLHGLAPDDLVTARKAVSLLPLWFQVHLASMDGVGRRFATGWKRDRSAQRRSVARWPS